MAKSILMERSVFSQIPLFFHKVLTVGLISAMVVTGPGIQAYAQSTEEAGKRSVVQVLPWADAPFTYSATGKALDEVLDDFARTFSLRLSLSSQFPSRVSGKFDRRSPTEFLDRLAIGRAHV